MAHSIPVHARLILLQPRRVLDNLSAIDRAGVVDVTPTLWQIELGVLRMWHRILFRSETIGVSGVHPVRPGWRARILKYRPLRFPFLLWEGSVRPWDLTGLLCNPEALMCHMLGTHHEGRQFVYDLHILSAHDGQLDELRSRTRRVVEENDRRSEWLRDLCVYEQYHETLLHHVDRVVDEGFAGEDDDDDPDITFPAFLRWCARQPDTPAATWRAWRRGEFSLAPEPGSA